jgi:hypothetical protein
VKNMVPGLNRRLGEMRCRGERLGTRRKKERNYRSDEGIDTLNTSSTCKLQPFGILQSGRGQTRPV